MAKFTKQKHHKRTYRRDEADIMAARTMRNDIDALKEIGIELKSGKGIDYYTEASKRLRGN